MPTLKDVAASAGVSLSTASRVIRGVGTVDEDLAQRVRRAVEEVGYRPDAVARNLRLGQTRVIALLIPDVANPFFTAVARAVEDSASAAGYSVLLCNTDENPAKEQAYLRIALQSRVAGIILAPHGDGDVRRDDADAIPIVGVNRPIHSRAGTQHVGDVLVDMALGMRQSVTHLVENGCRTVAFVAGADDERAAAFRDAAARSGVRAEVAVADLTGDGARRIAGRLLSAENPPDAVIVGSAPMLLGVLGAVRAADLTVGSDIAVLGVDDAPWTTLANPPLTVLEQPAAVVGSEAVRLLLAGQRVPEPVLLAPRLLVRDSTTLRQRPDSTLRAVAS